MKLHLRSVYLADIIIKSKQNNLKPGKRFLIWVQEYKYCILSFIRIFPLTDFYSCMGGFPSLFAVNSLSAYLSLEHFFLFSYLYVIAAVYGLFLTILISLNFDQYKLSIVERTKLWIRPRIDLINQID